MKENVNDVIGRKLREIDRKYLLIDKQEKDKYRPFENLYEFYYSALYYTINPVDINVYKTEGNDITFLGWYVIISMYEENGVHFKLQQVKYYEKANEFRKCKDNIINMTAQELYDNCTFSGLFICGIEKDVVIHHHTNYKELFQE